MHKQPAVCHDKVVNQQFAARSGSPQDALTSTLVIYGPAQCGNEANFDLCFPYHDHFIYNTMQNFFSKFVCSIIIYSLAKCFGIEISVATIKYEL